jgi:hypothetical protein
VVWGFLSCPGRALRQTDFVEAYKTRAISALCNIVLPECEVSISVLSGSCQGKSSLFSCALAAVARGYLTSISHSSASRSWLAPTSRRSPLTRQNWRMVVF